MSWNKGFNIHPLVLYLGDHDHAASTKTTINAVIFQATNKAYLFP